MYFRFGQAVVLTTALWLVRLANEAIQFSNIVAENLWLILVRPTLIVFFGSLFASVYVFLNDSLGGRKYWAACFALAAVFCLAYVPDMYASFVKAGEKQAVLLSLAFYCLGILTYGLIRGSACKLVTRLFSGRFHFRKMRSVCTFLAFLVIEYLFFHTWHPITYFPALPVPLPAARFERTTTLAPITNILFETMIDGETRTKIHSGSFPALVILGEKLAATTREGLAGKSMSDRVVVVLPETFVALDDIEDARLLIDPVSAVLMDEFKVSNIVWIQGAFVRNNNLVVGTEIDKGRDGPAGTTGRTPPITILRRKNEQMPMFEAPSKGISYSSRPEDVLFSEARPPREQKALTGFMEGHRILVCYESLFPANWKVGKPSLILTNHHLFNEFRLMNWVYFGFLRQLAFVFGSEVKVVSNFNDSGVLNPASRILFGSSMAPEGWVTLKLR